MEILFKDASLKELILDERRLVRKYGPQIAKITLQRVAEILACFHLTMLKELHPGLHPLVGGRKGQFAMDLGPAYRLVIEPANRPLPRRPDGTIVWDRVDCISIIEIIDYHDE